ncbi:lysophospholipid acyltransferase family protein [Elongatibacter sediminis]|uniref:1-acyl-sn-glycerol-3-phosphate acyltransferase n=1 Tax=Elongatibacter sediminis TaxID=3119006 RepID=A0AAW9RDR4_9GAMM
MKKLLYWPYQVYVWLVYLPLVAVLTLVFSTLTVITAVLVNDRVASRVFAVTWARLVAWLTPISVTVEGRQNADRKNTYVVVCNHQSQYDIPVVYGWLDLDLKWVMKQELRKIPGIGIGCEKAGHIFVNRRNPREARKAVMQALDRLGDGVGILFFAEGTRSDDGRLLPFKKGAFRLAIEQQLPVLPITITGTRDVLPARTLQLFPGRCTMHIHPPIDTTEMSLQDLDALLSETRAAIASRLTAPDRPADAAAPA